MAVTTPAGSSPDSGPDCQVSYVANEPTITSLSATSGPAVGGTTVTITGTNFYGASRVLFGEQLRDESCRQQFGDVNLRRHPAELPRYLSRDGRGGGVSNQVNFTYTPSAYITGVSPSSGLIAPGTLVTISGTDILPFEGVVDFGSIALTPLPVRQSRRSRS